MSSKRILVVQTAFLGDVLLTIPFLKRLRILYPQGRISFLARKGVARPLQELGLIDQVFEIEKGKSSTYKEVQNQIPSDLDLLFCVHESLRTKFFVSKLSAGKKIGFKGFLSRWFFDEVLERPQPLPEPLRVLSLLQNESPETWSLIQEQVQRLSPYALDSEMKLRFPLESFSMGMRDEILKQFTLSSQSSLMKKGNQRRVLVFPGSVWATKRWTTEGFSEVVAKLSGNHEVLLMGSKNEFELCETVRGSSPARNLAGETSLIETLFWMSQSDLVIGNDSGSAHLASMAEVPSLTLFGPTILEFGYRPWSEQATVLQVSLECRPCGPHGHHRCPLGTHDCMKKISSERVYKTALRLLN